MKILSVDFARDNSVVSIAKGELSLLRDITSSATLCYEATDLCDRGIEIYRIKELTRLLLSKLADIGDSRELEMKIAPSSLLVLSFISGSICDAFDDTNLGDIGVTKDAAHNLADELSRLLADAVPAPGFDPGLLKARDAPAT